jgi:DNA-binding MurR/RpiR family transcriptional regulator
MSAVTGHQSSRTVLVRIRSALPSLRASEQAIATAVLAEPALAATLSIGGLAEKCGTSTTSVVRFYKKIGYQGYSDFRMDLARETTREQAVANVALEMYEDIARTDSLQDVVSKIAFNETMSIADTAEALDVARLSDAVAALSGARRIDIFGVGASAWVGQDLQQKFHRIGLTAHSWSDAHSAGTSAALLGPDCVFVAISHSGSTLDTVEAMRIASDAGARTVAVTNHSDSPLARAADIVLTTAARESPFRSGALGSRMAQMMVIDCLFVGVAQQSYDSSIAALRKTYLAVQGRKVPQGGRP